MKISSTLLLFGLDNLSFGLRAAVRVFHRLKDRKWSGTRADFKKKAAKMEKAIESMVRRHYASDHDQMEEAIAVRNEKYVETLRRLGCVRADAAIIIPLRSGDIPTYREVFMNWFILVVAGLFEIGPVGLSGKIWAVALDKKT